MSNRKENQTPQTISFTETLHGYLGVQQAPIKISHLRLCIDVASREKSGRMQAQIEGGYVHAKKILGEDLVLRKGSFSLFNTVSNSHKSMNYRMLLHGLNSGKLYELQGEKNLTPRRNMPWRILDLWPDTTTVNIRLWALSNQNKRNLLGIGILNIRIFSFIKQVAGLRANKNLPMRKRYKTLFRFLASFSGSLWQIYGFPLKKTH